MSQLQVVALTWNVSRVLAVGATLLTVATIAISVIICRRPVPRKVVRDVVRVAISVSAIVLMKWITGVATPAGLVLLAAAGGLTLGLLQGWNSEVVRRDGRVLFAKAPVGLAAWGAGVIVMQGAGVASRVGVLRLGQGLSWLGAGILAGMIIGQASRLQAEVETHSTRAVVGSTLTVLAVVTIAGALVVGPAVDTGTAGAEATAGDTREFTGTGTTTVTGHGLSCESESTWRIVLRENGALFGEHDNPEPLVPTFDYDAEGNYSCQPWFRCDGCETDWHFSFSGTHDAASRTFAIDSFGYFDDTHRPFIAHGTAIRGTYDDGTLVTNPAYAGEGMGYSFALEAVGSVSGSPVDEGAAPAGEDADSGSVVAEENAEVPVAIDVASPQTESADDEIISSDEAIAQAIGGLIAAVAIGLISTSDAMVLINSMMGRGPISPKTAIEMTDRILGPDEGGGSSASTDGSVVPEEEDEARRAEAERARGEDEARRAADALARAEAERRRDLDLARQAETMLIETIRHGIPFAELDAELEAITARIAAGTATEADIARVRAIRDQARRVWLDADAERAAAHETSDLILATVENTMWGTTVVSKVTASVVLGPGGAAIVTGLVDGAGASHLGWEKAVMTGVASGVVDRLTAGLLGDISQLGLADRVGRSSLVNGVDAASQNWLSQLIEHDGDASKIDMDKVRSAGHLGMGLGAFTGAIKPRAVEAMSNSGRLAVPDAPSGAVPRGPGVPDAPSGAVPRGPGVPDAPSAAVPRGPGVPDAPSAAVVVEAGPSVRGRVSDGVHPARQSQGAIDDLEIGPGPAQPHLGDRGIQRPWDGDPGRIFDGIDDGGPPGLPRSPQTAPITGLEEPGFGLHPRGIDEFSPDLLDDVFGPRSPVARVEVSPGGLDASDQAIARLTRTLDDVEAPS